MRLSRPTHRISVYRHNDGIPQISNLSITQSHRCYVIVNGGRTVSGGSEMQSNWGQASRDIATFTTREVAVLRLVREGATPREIGDRLGVSEATIRVHLSCIAAKAAHWSRVGSTERSELNVAPAGSHEVDGERDGTHHFHVNRNGVKQPNPNGERRSWFGRLAGVGRETSQATASGHD